MLLSTALFTIMVATVTTQDIILQQLAKGDRPSYRLADLVNLDFTPKLAFTRDLSFWSVSAEFQMAALFPKGCTLFRSLNTTAEDGKSIDYVTAGLCWKGPRAKFSLLTQRSTVSADGNHIMKQSQETFTPFALDTFDQVVQFTILDSTRALLHFVTKDGAGAQTKAELTTAVLSLDSGKPIFTRVLPVEATIDNSNMWSKAFSVGQSVVQLVSRHKDGDSKTAFKLWVYDAADDTSPTAVIDLNAHFLANDILEHIEVVKSEDTTGFYILVVSIKTDEDEERKSTLCKIKGSAAEGFALEACKASEPFMYTAYDFFQSDSLTYLHGFNVSSSLTKIQKMVILEGGTLNKTTVFFTAVAELQGIFGKIRALSSSSSHLIEESGSASVSLSVTFTSGKPHSAEYVWVNSREQLVFANRLAYATALDTTIRLYPRSSSLNLYTDTTAIQATSITSDLIVVRDNEGFDESVKVGTLKLGSITTDTNAAYLKTSPPHLKIIQNQTSVIIDLVERGMQGTVIKPEIANANLTRNNFQWIDTSNLISQSSIKPGSIFKIIDENTIFQIIDNQVFVFVYLPAEGILTKTTYNVSFTVDWLLGYASLGEKLIIAVNSNSSLNKVTILQMCLTSKDKLEITFEMKSPYLSMFYFIEESFYYLVGSKAAGELKVFRRKQDSQTFEDLTKSITPDMFVNYATNTTTICPIEVSFSYKNGFVVIDVVSVCKTLQSLLSITFKPAGPEIYVHYIDDEPSELDGCVFQNFMYFVDRPNLTMSIVNRTDMRKQHIVDLKQLGYSQIFWFDCNEKHQLMFIPVAKNGSNLTDILLVDGWRDVSRLDQRASFIGTNQQRVATMRGISGKKTVFFSIGQAKGNYSFAKFYYDLNPSYTLKLKRPMNTLNVAIEGLSSKVLNATWDIDRVENPFKFSAELVGSPVKTQIGVFPLSKFVKTTGSYSRLFIEGNDAASSGFQIIPTMVQTSSSVIELVRTFDNDKILFTVNDFAKKNISSPLPMLAQDDVSIFMVTLKQLDGDQVIADFKSVDLSAGLCSDYALDMKGEKFVMAYNYTNLTVFYVNEAGIDVERKYNNLADGFSDMVRVRTCKVVNSGDVKKLSVASIQLNGALVRYVGVLPIPRKGKTIESKPGRLC